MGRSLQYLVIPVTLPDEGHEFDLKNMSKRYVEKIENPGIYLKQDEWPFKKGVRELSSRKYEGIRLAEGWFEKGNAECTYLLRMIINPESESAQRGDYPYVRLWKRRELLRQMNLAVKRFSDEKRKTPEQIEVLEYFEQFLRETNLVLKKFGQRAAVRVLH